MQNYEYDKIFNETKEKEYNSLVKEFNNFAEDYETKKQAKKEYFWRIRELNDLLKNSKIDGRDIIDSFKHAILVKINIVFNSGLKNPLKYLLKTHYADIIGEFNKTKEREVRQKETPSFSYDFFETYSKEVAVKLIAKIRAFNDLKTLLDNVEKADNTDANNYLASNNIKIEQNQNISQTNNNTANQKKEVEKKQKIIKKISLKYKYKDEVVKTLYNMLKETYSYINVSKEEFECHFEDNENNSYKKIVWNADEVEIVYLFDRLKTVNATPYKIILNHFKNQFDEEFTRSSLGKSLFNVNEIVKKEKTEYKNEIIHDKKEINYKNIKEIIKKVNSYK